MYGKGMVDKILALAADQDALNADLEARYAALVPLADAEQRRQAEAAAAAERELADQQRRCVAAFHAHGAVSRFPYIACVTPAADLNPRDVPLPDSRNGGISLRAAW